jgi:hypothetical protein
MRKKEERADSPSSKEGELGEGDGGKERGRKKKMKRKVEQTA